jgi:type III restriction enzyme
MKFKIESIKHQTEAVHKTLEALRGGKQRIDIEMETGTGKTFTFISSIFEIHKTLGLNKFVIVVPRVAIKEGVYGSFTTFNDFFKEKYPEINFDVYNYEGGKLGDVRQFISKMNLSILIITPHSFNKEANLLNDKTRDDLFSNGSYKEQIAELKPCVIIDETHITATEKSKSKEAIESLNPSIILGYSATHREKQDIVYTFSSKQAYEERQVKRLEYWGFEFENYINANFTISEFNTEKKTAKFTQNGKSKTIKEGSKIDDLTIKYITKDDVIFTNTKKYSEIKAGENMENYLLEEQIRATIQEHLSKKERLLSKGIKVLSLFFVPTVRDFIGNETSEGIVKKIFKEEYKKLTGEEVEGKYAYYFSETSKIKGTKDFCEKEMTKLILKEKGKLLSFENPVEFIFAHTSLGTGWDNPNIFQICFLRNINTEIGRKQFIGRGLRLCVNQEGERIFESKDVPDASRINNLTIIAGEKCKSFCNEYQRECGWQALKEEDNQIKQKVPTKTIKLKKERLELARELWGKLKAKTRWYVTFGKLDELYSKIAYELNSIQVESLKIGITKASVTSTEVLDYKNTAIKQEYNENEIIKTLSKETLLTNLELANIFKNIKTDNIKQNPSAWLSEAIKAINRAKEEHIMSLKEIEYELTGEEFETSGFEREDRSSVHTNTMESEKSLYDLVDFDSTPEKNAIQLMEEDKQVQFFVKFPKGANEKFHIPTPIGNYTPDFGIIVKNQNGKFYLVLEVKDRKIRELSPEERFKIMCAVKHFESLGFAVSPPEIEGEEHFNAHKRNEDLYSIYIPK